MLVLGTAAIGSYTTFSTWMLETHRPAQDGERAAGGWQNVASSFAVGLGAVALGRVGGRLAVSEAGIKLTTYFRERDRSGERFQADALFDVYERHRTADERAAARRRAGSASATACRPTAC